MGKGKVPVHIVQAYRRSWCIAPRILSRQYMNLIGELHAPTDLPPRKIPVTHSIGSWVSPRAILDVSEKRQISCRFRQSNPVSFSSHKLPFGDHFVIFRQICLFSVQLVRMPIWGFVGTQFVTRVSLFSGKSMYSPGLRSTIAEGLEM